MERPATAPPPEGPPASGVLIRICLYLDSEKKPVPPAIDLPPLPTTMPSFRQKPVDVVIDVRSKVEFWLGHLPEAICLPVQSIAESLPAMPEIAKDARILLVCASGARSAAAAEILKSLGYTRVVDGGATASARNEFAV